jgi:hypothetical protein
MRLEAWKPDFTKEKPGRSNAGAAGGYWRRSGSGVLNAMRSYARNIIPKRLTPLFTVNKFDLCA